MNHEKTALAARGKWRGILMEFGIPAQSLVNKHGKCPLCERDNFRWDNKEQRGSYICTCSAGSGFDLAMRVSGLGYREVADRIDSIVGNLKHEPATREHTEDDLRDMMIRAYRQTVEVAPGDLVHRYLASRRLEELVYPKSLRFGAKMTDGEGGIRPCMVAMVGVYGEPKFCSMHRTFLKPDGSGKAEMAEPKKLMPGTLPQGACVALSDYHGGPLGIAEGIETAMSASAIYGLPVWAALSAPMMEKWRPPEGCEEVAVFGDNDPKFGGQKAAFTLAHKLACLPGKKIHITVHIPPTPGEDWNDIWRRS